MWTNFSPNLTVFVRFLTFFDPSGAAKSAKMFKNMGIPLIYPKISYKPIATLGKGRKMSKMPTGSGIVGHGYIYMAE